MLLLSHHAALLDPCVWFYRHYKNRVRRRIYHIDPWPDPTRPKSLTRWPVTRRLGSNTATNGFWLSWKKSCQASRQSPDTSTSLQ